MILREGEDRLGLRFVPLLVCFIVHGFALAVYVLSEVLPIYTIAVDTISICVRVGNEVGAGNARVAKLSVAVLNGIGFLICFICALIVLKFRVGLIKHYFTDSQIIQITSSLFPLIALYFLINGNHFVLLGHAIGSGRQAIVGWVNLVIHVICFTLASLLGFKASLGRTCCPIWQINSQMGIFGQGLCWGWVIGVALQTIIVGGIILFTDWEVQVKNAAVRLRNSADGKILDDFIDD